MSDASPVSAEIRIQCDKPTAALSPHLYGLFFEDINFGADGGLYAELVQNRSFEYFSLHTTHPDTKLHPLFAWEKIERNGARSEIRVASENPLHRNNPNYLEIIIAEPGVAGVSNGGFDGIRIEAGARYDISLRARVAEWSGDKSVTATLELPDGSSAGSFTFHGIGSDWTKCEGVLIAQASADNARLVVTTPGKGTIALDMISLFPQDTFKGRKNGLRKDLAQALADLNPKFLRFPGGCIAHGYGLKNLYRWKDSVGPVEERKPNWNLWGYHQTYGLGYFEYFQFCEDLGMAPLPVIPVGVSCGFRGLEVVPMDQLEPHIQDALDLIEFANGPASSRWGAVRAAMGHPEPFRLEYVCLGNEEHDNPEVRERYPHFAAAIRKAHPEIKIIGTSGLGPEIPLYDLMTREKVYSSDEHYYELPEWFIRHQNRFDTFDRNKPKIFVGEYASWSNTLFSALAEAAYLTGVERNGDMVDMTCYAPLFGREGHTQWNPNLIYFDKSRVLRTANYYVQQLFAQNKGDTAISNSVKLEGQPAVGTISGHFGIGSAKGAIEIAEVSVNGQKTDPARWKTTTGDLTEKDGSKILQPNAKADLAMLLGSDSTAGATTTFKARVRKSGAGEGILVLVGADAEGRGGYVWTAGACDNSRHLLEQVADYRLWSKLLAAEVPGRVSESEWHDLEVELSPARIRCSFDGKEVIAHKIPAHPVSVGSTFDRQTGEVIIKLVNPNSEPVGAKISLAGAKTVASDATLITFAGDKTAKNTFEKPDAVKPVTSKIPTAPEFAHTIPAMAVQFIRVKTE